MVIKERRQPTVRLIEERFVTPDGKVISQVRYADHLRLEGWFHLRNDRLWIDGQRWVGPWRLEARELPDGEWVTAQEGMALPPTEQEDAEALRTARDLLISLASREKGWVGK